MIYKKVVRILLGACLLSAAPLVYSVEGTPRHMIFASDTQYPWTDKLDRREPESDADFNSRSKWLVESQFASIADFRKNNAQSHVPVMINGDITAFGHGWQRSFMQTALKKYFKDDYLYGLGNHDYENNVDDCFTNNCAAGSIVEFKEHHEGKVENFDLKVTGNFLSRRYSGSLAYSTNIGEVHMVQLNNEPTHTTKIAHALNPTTFDITSALDWLETDLKIARIQGYAIIINMHKPEEMMGNSAQARRFYEMIKKYEVTAIFAGHYHQDGGAAFEVNGVPMYLSGATSQQTYLIASFSEDRKQLDISLVTNNQWQTRELLDTVPVKSVFARRS